MNNLNITFMREILEELDVNLLCEDYTQSDESNWFYTVEKRGIIGQLKLSNFKSDLDDFIITTNIFA